MIERFIIVLLLLAAGCALYRLYVRGQLGKAATAIPMDPLLAGFQSNIPAIVYFTTPTCAPCRFQQTPTLQQLLDEMGDQNVQIIRVDATEHPDAADRWGVFSVPTTFVLDKAGQPRQVFNGVVDLATLKRELQMQRS